MGYAGKLELQTKAKSLRREGFSIKEIQKKLNISRSSASIWVRNVKLTNEQIQKLYANKKTGGLKGSFIAAQNKIKCRNKQIASLLNEGRKDVGIMAERDKFVCGIALYLAEGNKNDGSVSFTNSDSRVMKFIINWFRKFCRVSESKFRCYLYIHDNLDELEAKSYWSKLLSVPLEQFRKSYIVKNNPKRIRKNKHQYGVLKITISDINLHRKIMGWTSGLLEN